MMRAVFLSAVLLATPAFAALLDLPIDDTVRYLQPESLPADLPPTPAKATSLVLDLRFAAISPDTLAPLESWLRTASSQDATLFVLVNTTNPPELHALLARLAPHLRLLTVGSGPNNLPPDISVQTPPDAEQRTFDLLRAHAPIESLLIEHADKPRADEASLTREHKQPPPPAASNASPAAASPPPTTPPPLDRTLQRAVQLHRAQRPLHASR